MKLSNKSYVNVLSNLIRNLSYESYPSTRKIKYITNDPLMDRPILLLEKVSKTLGVRPYFLGILLLISWPIVLWLCLISNPDLFWRQYTKIDICINFIIWTPLYLIFFHFLPFMKENYYRTVESLRPIISQDKYDNLKKNFIKKEVFYGSLVIIYSSMFISLLYELKLGFIDGKLWSEGMPEWSGFRYGPFNVILSIIGGIITYGFCADILNGCYSWLHLPYILNKWLTDPMSLDDPIYRDPNIISKYNIFREFDDNMRKMASMIILMMILVSIWFYLEPLPYPPFAFLWLLVMIFLGVYLLRNSRKNSIITSAHIDALKRDYDEYIKRGLDCSAAEAANNLYILRRQDKSEKGIRESQNHLIEASNKYEECGDFGYAAQCYSKLGNHQKAASCYNKASNYSYNPEYKQFYEACENTELAEYHIQNKKDRDNSIYCLNNAKNLFENVIEITKNINLRSSAIYRSRESEGRRLILEGLKSYEIEIIKQKNLDKTLGYITRAQEIFEDISEKNRRISPEAKKRLKIDHQMCECYKQCIILQQTNKYIRFEEIFAGEYGANIRPISFMNIWFKKHKEIRKNKSINHIDSLSCTVDLIQKLIIELKDVGDFKSAKKAEMASLALEGYKYLYEYKIEKCSNNIKIAERILKAEFGEYLRSNELKEKLNELINLFFYTDFRFSAPMCIVVDDDSYKNCILFEQVNDIPKKVGLNEDIDFLFKIGYRNCNNLYLNEKIDLKLLFDAPDNKRIIAFSLIMGNDPITLPFLIKANKLGKNSITAKLLHVQEDYKNPKHHMFEKDYIIDVLSNENLGYV